MADEVGEEADDEVVGEDVGDEVVGVAGDVQLMITRLDPRTSNRNNTINFFIFLPSPFLFSLFWLQ